VGDVLWVGADRVPPRIADVSYLAIEAEFHDDVQAVLDGPYSPHLRTFAFPDDSTMTDGARPATLALPAVRAKVVEAKAEEERVEEERVEEERVEEEKVEEEKVEEEKVEEEKVEEEKVEEEKVEEEKVEEEKAEEEKDADVNSMLPVSMERTVSEDMRHEREDLKELPWLPRTLPHPHLYVFRKRATSSPCSRTTYITSIHP
jgi:flagellar biosynthesis GTPase FlhF